MLAQDNKANLTARAKKADAFAQKYNKLCKIIKYYAALSNSNELWTILSIICQHYKDTFVQKYYKLWIMQMLILGYQKLSDFYINLSSHSVFEKVSKVQKRSNKL
jgi:hypothetical protein